MTDIRQKFRLRPGERHRLIPRTLETLLILRALRHVRSHRHKTPRPTLPVALRYDQCSNPIPGTLLCSISQRASPIPTRLYGRPQVFKKLRRMLSRIQQPMILSDELIFRIAGALAKFRIHILYIRPCASVTDISMCRSKACLSTESSARAAFRLASANLRAVKSCAMLR